MSAHENADEVINDNQHGQDESYLSSTPNPSMQVSDA